MSLEDITPALQKKLHIGERRGIVVTDVTQGSAEEEAGIEAGDIVRRGEPHAGPKCGRIPGRPEEGEERRSGPAPLEER